MRRHAALETRPFALQHSSKPYLCKTASIDILFPKSRNGIKNLPDQSSYCLSPIQIKVEVSDMIQDQTRAVRKLCTITILLLTAIVLAAVPARAAGPKAYVGDRKSTRLNSSHLGIS